jgi:Family of unknown function (DUF6221)
MGRVDDLIAFLKARLDEDEASAKAAYCKGPSEQQPTAPPEGAWWTVPQIMTALGPGTYLDAGHIARHDPGRALREVAAVREILDMAEERAGRDLPEGVHDGRDPDERERDEDLAAMLGEVVRIHAAIWDDHPGYRPEWRP